MMNDIRVFIVEDDIYARDMMGILLRRDWRTQVIGEMGSMMAIPSHLERERIDVILLDMEHPSDIEWPRRMIEIVERLERRPAILCTGTHPSCKVLERMTSDIFRGYILKSEIGYSLAWAVTLATSEHWVVTPSIEKLACDQNIELSPDMVVLSGDTSIYGLSPQELEIARLGILFNLPRDNLADDINRSPYTVYEYISNSYEKMGIDEIFSRKISPREYFTGDDRFLHHFGSHIDQLWDISKPNKDKETLAFHLLTIPVIH